MKVIKINEDIVQCKFTGIGINKYEVIIFFKDGKWHNDSYQAAIYQSGYKYWWYKDTFYGRNNDFTIKTWKKKVKEIKLSIFK